jgi:hypothetical protein
VLELTGYWNTVSISPSEGGQARTSPQYTTLTHQPPSVNIYLGEKYRFILLKFFFKKKILK